MEHIGSNMKTKEIIVESTSMMYHVTLTKKVPRIKKLGITSMNPTNFAKGSGERYGEIGEIYAMSSKKDAIRWSVNWEWELFKEPVLGSGKVSIVTFEDDPNEWEIDHSDPISQSGNEGKWFKKNPGWVKPEQIIDAEPVTLDMIKAAKFT